MILILTGPLHGGKTTLLRAAADGWLRNGTDVDGYLSPALWKGGRVLGYNIQEIRTGETRPFIRREGRAGWERIGAFFFIPEGLGLARRLIRRGRKAGICVVDEIGPLELEGGGVRRALEAGLRGSPADWLLVVREPLVADFRVLLGGDPRVIDVRDPAASDRLTGVWKSE